MVLAWQPLVSYLGPAVTNTSGHSFMSRFLFTVIPSQMYAKKTLDVLLQALVTDLEDIYQNGVEVLWQLK
ncbi:unnamed protein product [Symbiodinium sp. KB8]|nr:unnamed protein product [Symbiodinium sp. KB8]